MRCLQPSGGGVECAAGKRFACLANILPWTGKVPKADGVIQPVCCYVNLIFDVLSFCLSLEIYKFSGLEDFTESCHCALDAQSQEFVAGTLALVTPYQVRGDDCTLLSHSIIPRGWCRGKYNKLVVITTSREGGCKNANN